MAGVVQLGQQCSDRDGLARADLARDDAEGAFADAPGDAGDDQVACALMTDHPKTGLGDVLAHVVHCDHDGEEPDLSGGRRVEYVVTGIRGALVDAHAVDDPARKYVSPAAVLARNLKTEVGSLLGCHFSCRVVPGNPGTFFVDFQMTPESDDQALA